MPGGVDSLRSSSAQPTHADGLQRAAGVQQNSKLLLLDEFSAESPMVVSELELIPCGPNGRTRSALDVLRAASASELEVQQPNAFFSLPKDAAAHRASLRDRLEWLDVKTRMAKQKVNAAARTTTADLIRPKSFVNPTSTMSQASTSVPPLVAPTAPPPAPAPASVALRAPLSRYASPSNMEPPRPIRPKYVSSPSNERREARRAKSTIHTRNEQHASVFTTLNSRNGPMLSAAKVRWIKQYGSLSGHAMEAYSEYHDFHNKTRFVSTSSHKPKEFSKLC